MLFSREDVERLLPPQECITAVEDAFPKLAQGKVPPPGILSMHPWDGSFHLKASSLTLDLPAPARLLPRDGCPR